MSHETFENAGSLAGAGLGYIAYRIFSCGSG
jgi:hypothetical protein